LSFTTVLAVHGNNADGFIAVSEMAADKLAIAKTAWRTQSLVIAS
jgi:hypothetical protein